MKGRVALQYGRTFEEFEVGAVYAHPWDVTVDAGTVALWQGSFLDATPTYASSAFAKGVGFGERPIAPLLLLNFGLSFSVHDVSEQAIAHLAYLDVRFPNACHEGDTLTASSKVLGVERASSGDKGVVHVRTVLMNDRGLPVCVFERKALVRVGKGDSARRDAGVHVEQYDVGDVQRLPRELRELPNFPERPAQFAGVFEDFAPGLVMCHRNGKTVGESEHMQLTSLVRNTHPLHFDENYCKEGNSFAGTRVVYGGLVFSWIASLASRDTTGNVIWDLGFDAGAHPAGVVAGDTLYATSKIVDRKELRDDYGEVTIRLVGTKNTRPEALLEKHGDDFFAPELGKPKERRVEGKVFEITRTVLMKRG